MLHSALEDVAAHRTPGWPRRAATPASCSARGSRCSRRCRGSAWWWWTRSTTPPSSSRKACATPGATRRCCAPSSPAARWCSAPRRRRSRPGTTAAPGATSCVDAARARRARARGCPRCARSTCARSRTEHGLRRNRWSTRSARASRAREQSLVFINRRGYAPVLACEACGWAAGCTRCSARLVLHPTDRPPALPPLRRGRSAIPRACPTCGNVDLQPLGRGTQRVEETLAAPLSRTRASLRIDRDSARRRGELARTLEGIGRGEGDILVGTQLLAKGHDFPNLTLVGVLNADSALLSTDYRSAERLFAMLAQVGGPRRPARAAGRSAGADALSRAPAVRRRSIAPRLRRLRRVAARRARKRRASRPSFTKRRCAPRRRSSRPRWRFLSAAARAGAPCPRASQIYDPVPHVITRRAGFERAQLAGAVALAPGAAGVPRRLERARCPPPRRAACAGTSTSTRSNSTRCGREPSL